MRFSSWVSFVVLSQAFIKCLTLKIGSNCALHTSESTTCSLWQVCAPSERLHGLQCSSGMFCCLLLIWFHAKLSKKNCNDFVYLFYIILSESVHQYISNFENMCLYCRWMHTNLVFHCTMWLFDDYLEFKLSNMFDWKRINCIVKDFKRGDHCQFVEYMPARYRWYKHITTMIMKSLQTRSFVPVHFYWPAFFCWNLKLGRICFPFGISRIHMYISQSKAWWYTDEQL